MRDDGYRASDKLTGGRYSRSGAVFGGAVLSTSRASDPSGLEASVRNTAWPGSVRQIEVVTVSPGNTGEVDRDATALTFVASPKLLT
jgi:hypothetical protein